jgi:hypothetical protein
LCIFWVGAVGAPGGIFYTAVAGSGLYASDQRGELWELFDPHPEIDRFSSATALLLTAPSLPSTLYFVGDRSPLTRSIDGGASWTPALGAGECLGITSLQVDPLTPSTLYGTGNFGGPGCTTREAAR